MIPLIFAPVNKELVIETIKGGKNSNLRLNELGLVKGKIVKIVNKRQMGPILLQVDNSRLAIGQGIALKIIVKI